jgi:hypothetical protein
VPGSTRGAAATDSLRESRNRSHAK